MSEGSPDKLRSHFQEPGGDSQSAAAFQETQRQVFNLSGCSEEGYLPSPQSGLHGPGRGKEDEVGTTETKRSMQDVLTKPTQKCREKLEHVTEALCCLGWSYP